MPLSKDVDLGSDPVQTLSLPGSSRILLCSDIHLHDEDPALTQWFLQWLSQHAADVDWLLVLGDLFDTWVGDDQMGLMQPGHTPAWRSLAEALRSIRVKHPLHVGLMKGNRDFLMGATLCESLGAVPLADQVLVFHPVWGQASALLSHGDEFCIEDKAYQAWRKQARDPRWQSHFLAKSLSDRLQIAQGLRAQSESEKSDKPSSIMDVAPYEADRQLSALGAECLIHGHTHRPGHDVLPSGRPRWVLPDWSAAPGERRGGGLRIDAGGITPVPASPNVLS